jgi:glycine betaine/proline transport system ATP-binding protein
MGRPQGGRIVGRHAAARRPGPRLRDRSADPSDGRTVFSALDPLIRAKLQDELLDLQAKLKRTIVFVSHDLDEAFKIGNRIALMEGGRIVQCGTAREIIANPVSDYVADFVAHMNPLGRPDRARRDAARAGTEGASVAAETPVKEVMEALRQGAAALSVTEAGRQIGTIRSADVMGRLLNPRGA